MAWNDLTMSQRAEVIQMAVKNGMRDLNQIKSFYDESIGSSREYKRGGYLDWKEKASRYKHLNIDNDRTYDYEGWYNENPRRAWDFLNDSPDAHFDDKYKTVYHPTFSTQSKYSGIIDSKFNPQGLIGGTWSEDNHTFTMSPDGYRGPVSMDERKAYLENAEDNGVQLREADGSLPVYDNIIWGGILPNVTVKPRRFAMGGPEETIIASSDNTRVNYQPSVYVGDSYEVQDALNRRIAAEGKAAYATGRFLPYIKYGTDVIDWTSGDPTDAMQMAGDAVQIAGKGVANRFKDKNIGDKVMVGHRNHRRAIKLTQAMIDDVKAFGKVVNKTGKIIALPGFVGDIVQSYNDYKNWIKAEQNYNDVSSRVFNERVKTHPAVRTKYITKK